MHNIVLITGGMFAIIAVILGAFGAHAFKKIISPEKLASFEVGVRYQMYSALALILFGHILSFDVYSERLVFYSITLGTILFSGSIFFLSFSEYWNKNLKFLGPITPLGGLFMIVGWASFIVSLF